MAPAFCIRAFRPAPGALAGLAVPVLLGGCGPAPAALSGGSPQALPLPAGIRVAFNHRGNSRYRSPISGQWRQGDDLEVLLLESIREARQEILVAVQELSLPALAEALAERHRQGVRVRVVLENLYSAPWSQQHPVDLPPHQRQRQLQLAALGQGDAVAVLQRAGVPVLDDTADGSRGSGLMHHKFLVVDGRVVVTGSANFSPSCVHGDAGAPSTRGNVNHLLRFDSPALAGVFAAEFARLWGDGPGGQPDSRFGIAKQAGGAQVVDVAGTSVEVLFTPHRRRDPNHGLAWLETKLASTNRRLDLALFVFSGQNLADRLQELHGRGVKIRLLADPGFANRAFSETLDLLGVTLPDHNCKIEARNRPWSQPLEGVGTPQLARGDKLHHKFAVLDGRAVISGSFNWSPSAAFQNDETLLLIRSPLLARHFEAEVDRLWRGAELGISGRLARRMEQRRRSCGSGTQRAAEAAPGVTTTIP
ncbi:MULTISPECIES: phosphatidylserine/phosphatidylglycerophosphate/cardiolipin synthase family protein [unclassified Cyanobium]|uniref:phospholipase D-like domain-containing protein n=1 Tax=unclassified Cyanobium TaxID=2627006 RepID=UPI0020CBBE32|nr:MULTISPECIES: phosphatidylserine/phosphatidylglycerophosphate/cardiolipin synthase family protein [unclassified Cyanobium]MCP9860771.1 phosphatidylserine/phosphatidylglycerophosphate/cardiolipin synthase family protein [Cyanobium sp. Cruz-8H5]MCP9868131.1 phosphatidylserine/phosphatidylglycerophosphate/cardiolipin synthase family protein [Cyanobium sp. Cruz-8D1]